MTIGYVIETVNALKPNKISRAMKVGWLADLDQRAFDDVIMTHEWSGDDEPSYTPYESTDQDSTELLITGSEARDIYVYYIESMIDRENYEISKYNASSAFFNAAYNAWSSDYNRDHRHINRKTYKF